MKAMKNVFAIYNLDYRTLAFFKKLKNAEGEWSIHDTKHCSDNYLQSQEIPYKSS